MKKILKFLIGPSLLELYRDIKTKRFNRSKIYLCDPFTIGIIAVTAAAITSEQIGQSLLGMDSMFGKGYNDKGVKDPNKPNAPAVPSMDTAAETANKEQTDARRALLLSGGETSLTGPGGSPILGGMTSSKTLLGV
jgi:hypothetical protein